jgi:hypothetical protein
MGNGKNTMGGWQGMVRTTRAIPRWNLILKVKNKKIKKINIHSYSSK